MTKFTLISSQIILKERKGRKEGRKRKDREKCGEWGQECERVGSLPVISLPEPWPGMNIRKEI